MSDYLDLIKKLKKYREKRGWNDNVPEDIAKSIVIESSELLEEFQWSNSHDTEITTEKKQRLKDEIGDIVIYLTALCETLNVDLVDCTKQKLEKVIEKYPADKITGENSENFYYKQKEEYRE